MPTRTTVVVDQDGGLDDALALILLARAPGIEIVGIGSVHGNVTAEAAASNGLRALELGGNRTTPVAVGAAEPLAQPLHLAHPEDLLGKLAGAPKRAPAPAETAAEQLVRLAHEHAGEIDLLTLGPLTNIALALRAEPELPRLLRRVVSMAGALTVKGNISEHAESNVWHDPEAAAEVMTAGFDLTLVPLDVTRKATVTRLWARTPRDRPGPALGASRRNAPGSLGKLPAFRSMTLWPARFLSTRRPQRIDLHRSRSISRTIIADRPAQPKPTLDRLAGPAESVRRAPAEQDGPLGHRRAPEARRVGGA